MRHVWRVDHASFRYPGATNAALEAVSLEITPGSSVAIVGPNGSGKSTLLRLLAGSRRAIDGSVEFRDRPIEAWTAAEIAREVGIMAQHEWPAFPITVRALVAMGRFPHLGNWRREGQADRDAIDEAMRRCRVEEIADRDFETLSGGERQRARLARALAQEPDALLLDEPTASLDIAAEMGIWRVLDRAARDGTTIVLSTHNLNLAARYAERVVLLSGGRVVAAGEPGEVLSEGVVSAAYQWPMRVIERAWDAHRSETPFVVPLDRGDGS